MAKQSELLTVVKVSENRQDKNGRNYKVVTFQGPQHKEILDITTGELMTVRVPARTSSITRYEESYLDDKMQYMYDAEVGEKVPGAIVTREVPEYEINGRPVYSYSTVVLGMTSEPGFETQVLAAFKSAGHDLTTSDIEQPINDRVAAVSDVKEVEPATEDAAF